MSIPFTKTLPFPFTILCLLFLTFLYQLLLHQTQGKLTAKHLKTLTHHTHRFLNQNPPYLQTKRPTPPNPFPIFQLSKHLIEEEEKKGSGSYCRKKKIKLKRRWKRWQRDTLGTVREYKRLTVKIWGIQMKKMKIIRREESEDKPTI